MDAQPDGRRKRQFGVGKLLLLTSCIAVLLGSCTAVHRARSKQAQLLTRLATSEAEAAMGQLRVMNMADMLDARQGNPFFKEDGIAGQGNPFFKADLQRQDLSQTVIRSTQALFVHANLQGSDLTNARLTGGGGSFQKANFVEARLQGCELSGAHAAFQLANFDKADLRDAVLSGETATLQGASLAGADLRGARLIGGPASMQNCNLDGTKFQGADLSGLGSNSLQACFFAAPPVYDEQTVFPTDFDPVAEGWWRE